MTVRVIMKRLCLLALVLCPATAAQAEWKEAVSNNFIVYSEGPEDELRKRAETLEKYLFVLRFVTNTNKPHAPVKLRVFMVPDATGVQRTMAGGGREGVGGYYTARSRGPVSIMPRSGAGISIDPQWVLFHEYAHHFMFQYFPAAYPSWYSEGFAEYYGSTRFLDNDVVEVGHLAMHRFNDFRYSEWIPMEKLLTAKSYGDVGGNIGMLYAQGWLLVHYLSGDKERAAQLAQYLKAINAGTDYTTAMNEAFGKRASKLNIDLRVYGGKRRFELLRLPFKPINVGPITLRTLGAAEQAMVPYEIKLSRGLRKFEFDQFAREVRAIAQRFPGDPHALSMLTEAERIVGNSDAAMSAVNNWLAVQPNSARALIHKGSLQVEALKAAGSKDQNAWNAARQFLVRASKAAPLDAMAYEAYYDSFIAEGVLPPANAQNALYRAFELVPQAPLLRYKVAADFDKRDMVTDAIEVIKPLAYQLHGDDDGEKQDPKKQARQDRLEERWREAYTSSEKLETPWEMLRRLEKKLADQGGAPAAQTTGG